MRNQAYVNFNPHYLGWRRKRRLCNEWQQAFSNFENFNFFGSIFRTV